MTVLLVALVVIAVLMLMVLIGISGSLHRIAEINARYGEEAPPESDS